MDKSKLRDELGYSVILVESCGAMARKTILKLENKVVERSDEVNGLIDNATEDWKERVYLNDRIRELKEQLEKKEKLNEELCELTYNYATGKIEGNQIIRNSGVIDERKML